ncbi:hypothetical protein CLOP_g2665, partial [Closterium sp. NIES-67]
MRRHPGPPPYGPRRAGSGAPAGAHGYSGGQGYTGRGESSGYGGHGYTGGGFSGANSSGGGAARGPRGGKPTYAQHPSAQAPAAQAPPAAQAAPPPPPPTPVNPAIAEAGARAVRWLEEAADVASRGTASADSGASHVSTAGSDGFPQEVQLIRRVASLLQQSPMAPQLLAVEPTASRIWSLLERLLAH